MFDVITIECVCIGDNINYSMGVVKVVRALKFDRIVYVELSNGVKHCYKCGCLVRRYK